MAEKFLYLTTTGRVTGNPHTIEIWYVDYGDCFVLCAEHRGKSDWVQNIQQEASVEFYVAERDTPPQPLSGTATILTDETDIQAVSTLFDEKYKWSNGLFVQICAEK